MSGEPAKVTIVEILDKLPLDAPTKQEMTRGYWTRRTLINTATGEIEVERIPDIYER